MENIVFYKSGANFIKGVSSPIILNNRGNYLTHINIYADNTIHCLGNHFMIEDLERLLDSGKLTRSLPEGDRLFIPYIGNIWTESSTPTAYDNRRFIEIIKETIRELSEAELPERECRRRFKDYLIEPSIMRFEELKEVYSRLPNDQAIFEFDLKDPLIQLMRAPRTLTVSEREHLLNEYFEGEWIELK